MNTSCSSEKIKMFIFGVLAFVLVLDQSLLSSIFPIVKWSIKIVILICLLVPLIFERFSEKTFNSRVLLLYAFFAIVTVINFIFNQGSYKMLVLLIYMFYMRNVVPERVLGVHAKAVFCALGFIIGLYLLGVFKNVVLDYEKYSSENRENIGFSYATFGANYFLHGVLAYIGSKKGKIKLLPMILIAVINIWIFKKTQTEATFLLVFFALFLVLLCRLRSIKNVVYNNSLIAKIMINFCIIACIITFILQYCYIYHNNSLLLKINSLISNRLELGKIAFSRYRIKLLGQPIEWVTYTTEGLNYFNYFYVDSSYLQILLQYGIVTLVIICLLMRNTCKYALYKKNINLCIALVVLLIHCIVDPQLLSVSYNPFLLVSISSIIFMGVGNEKKSTVTIENLGGNTYESMQRCSYV